MYPPFLRFILHLFGCLAVAVLCIFSACAAERGDVLIIERPQALSIFNRYQQRISSEEQSQFLPFTPFILLKENDVMGDGFTPCMTVELEGTKYYLEKDDDGSLHGTDVAGGQKILRSVMIINDTVEILRGRPLKSLDGAVSMTIQDGDRVVRVCSQNGNTYVKLLGAHTRFGWSELGSGGRDWKSVERVGSTVSEQIDVVLPRVTRKVNDVNATLGRLYEYFNRTASRQLSQPEWHVQRVGKTIVCERRAVSTLNDAVASTQLLGKHFEGILLGTDLRVYIGTGRIEIRR